MPVSRTAKATVPADGADTLQRHCTGVGELQGVREQVLEDLPEALLVGLDSFGRGRLDDDVEAAAPSACAVGWNDLPSASTACATITGSGCTSTLPASIFDRSRMSLMSVSRSLPAEEMVCANFTCSSVRLPVLVVGEQLREDQRRVQRRAQLVAHVGQELALVLVGALELGRLLGEDRRLRERQLVLLSLEQLRLLLQLRVGLLELRLLVLEPRLRLLENVRLLLELLVADAQLLLLRLQFLGLSLRFFQQLLEPRPVLRRSDGDAERFGDALEQLADPPAAPDERTRARAPRGRRHPRWPEQ